MGVRIEISARLIRWPPVCACCLGRSNDVLRATSTRVTGKRVVRTDSRSWNVPYCSACLDHIDAEQHAHSISGSGAITVMTLGIVLGLLVAVFGGCCCGPAVFAPRPATDGNQGGSVGVVLVGIASVIVGAGIGVGGYFWYRRLDAEIRRQRARALDRAEAMASSRCCTLRPAVVYEGWYGSVHTFWFANRGYADAFIRSNPGKVL
jgi:hypothetical protein